LTCEHAPSPTATAASTPPYNRFRHLIGLLLWGVDACGNTRCRPLSNRRADPRRLKNHARQHVFQRCPGLRCSPTARRRTTVWRSADRDRGSCGLILTGCAATVVFRDRSDATWAWQNDRRTVRRSPCLGAFAMLGRWGAAA